MGYVHSHCEHAQPWPSRFVIQVSDRSTSPLPANRGHSPHYGTRWLGQMAFLTRAVIRSQWPAIPPMTLFSLPRASAACMPSAISWSIPVATICALWMQKTSCLNNRVLRVNANGTWTHEGFRSRESSKQPGAPECRR